VVLEVENPTAILHTVDELLLQKVRCKFSNFLLLLGRLKLDINTELLWSHLLFGPGMRILLSKKLL
jgi:hypothetical protein